MSIQKIILIICIVMSFNGFSQESGHFKLTDKSVKVGQTCAIKVVFSMVEIYYSETEKPVDLNKLYQFLINNPKVKIEIIQHMEVRGNAKANLTMSRKQAESVKFYLEEKGISTTRIIAVGKGESEPIYKEEEINSYKTTDKVRFEEMHKANRRTIIKITALS